MEDRLGIEVTVDDPEAWNIGKPPAGTAAQEPTGVLHGITSMSNPSTTIQSEKKSLYVNSGIEQGEAPSYPSVVGLTWDFQESKQSTTLQLADKRLEPQGA
jgi:hypothetical protein